MDDTQRNIIGGLGGAGAVAGTGLLATHSYLLGSLLVLVGLLIVVVAFRPRWGSRRVMDLTDRRQALDHKIVNIAAQGNAILSSLDLSYGAKEVISWQTAARRLLSQALVSPDAAQYFHQMGPSSGKGLAVQLRNQIDYLGQISRDLPMHAIRVGEGGKKAR